MTMSKLERNSVYGSYQSFETYEINVKYKGGRNKIIYFRELLEETTLTKTQHTRLTLYMQD